MCPLFSGKKTQSNKLFRLRTKYKRFTLKSGGGEGGCKMNYCLTYLFLPIKKKKKLTLLIISKVFPFKVWSWQRADFCIVVELGAILS